MLGLIHSNMSPPNQFEALDFFCWKPSSKNNQLMLYNIIHFIFTLKWASSSRYYESLAKSKCKRFVASKVNKSAISK